MQVYIAGPMRDVPHFGFPVFDAARDWLLRQGWAVVSPADEDRATWGKPDDYMPTEQDAEDFDVAAYHAVMRDDIATVLQSDAIALLPGWENSAGATTEHAVARAIGLVVFEVPEEIVNEAVWPADEADTDPILEALLHVGGPMPDRHRLSGRPFPGQPCEGGQA